MKTNNKNLILAVLMLGMAAQPVNAGLWSSVGGFFSNHWGKVACGIVGLFLYSSLQSRLNRVDKKYNNHIKNCDGGYKKNLENLGAKLNQAIKQQISGISSQLDRNLVKTNKYYLKNLLYPQVIEKINKIIGTEEDNRLVGYRFNEKLNKKNFPGKGRIISTGEYEQRASCAWSSDKDKNAFSEYCDLFLNK